MTEKDAKELYNLGNYEKALEVYQKLWNESEKSEIWLGWGLARTLNKLKSYDEALKICKKVLTLKPDFEYIRSVYLQAAYLGKIKNYSDDQPYHLLESYINRIIQINADKDYDLFLNLSLIKVMTYCSRNNRWDQVIKWGKVVNVEELKDEPFITDQRRYIPSDKESWYLKISKAHQKNQAWNECLDSSKQGLQLFKDSPQMIWFKLRIAVSEYHLKSKEEGLKSLIDCYSIKKDWFIAHQIAQLYFENNEIDQAEKYYIEACIKTQRRSEFGIKLYDEVSIFYEKKGDIDLARKHLSLSISIREKFGWKIKESLQNKAKDLKLEYNKDTILKEMVSIWEKINNSHNPRISGFIKAILPNGKSGFITSENNEDYFFKFNGFMKKVNKVNIGDKVSFILEKSFDRKKNQDSFIANQISLK